MTGKDLYGSEEWPRVFLRLTIRPESGQILTPELLSLVDVLPDSARSDLAVLASSDVETLLRAVLIRDATRRPPMSHVVPRAEAAWRQAQYGNSKLVA